MMKTSIFALMLLLFVQVTTVTGKKTETGTGYCPVTLASVFKVPDSTVKVHFVRGLFTAEQKQVLWQTLETLAQPAQETSKIKFLDGGETGGLIDCLGCLTLTRQDLHTKDARNKASFNRLRGDPAGQLTSAWIGFDSAIKDSQKLRGLLVQMLGPDQLGLVATCKNAHLQETPHRHN
jgi:hypothetical protein